MGPFEGNPDRTHPASVSCWGEEESKVLLSTQTDECMAGGGGGGALPDTLSGVFTKSDSISLDAIKINPYNKGLKMQQSKKYIAAILVS